MKRIISMLLAVMSVAALTACGQQKDTAVDAQGLAKALVEKVSFESELTAISDEELGYYFQLPEGCTAAAYMSSGSTAEEVFVIQCKSGDDAAALRASMQEFLDSQKPRWSGICPPRWTASTARSLRPTAPAWCCASAPTPTRPAASSRSM